jgi:hypothetical protein
MEWINAEEEKPYHGDIVIAAIWRPEHHDYMHFICIWNTKLKQWEDHGDGIDFEKNIGNKILYWSDIDDPDCPDEEE